MRSARVNRSINKQLLSGKSARARSGSTPESLQLETSNLTFNVESSPIPTKSNSVSAPSSNRPSNATIFSLSADDQYTEISNLSFRHALTVAKKLDFSAEESLFIFFARDYGLERAIVKAAKFHLKFRRPLLALLEALQSNEAR